MGKVKDFGLFEKSKKNILNKQLRMLFFGRWLYVTLILQHGINLGIHAILDEQRGSIKLLSNFINFGDEPLIL